MSAELLHAIEDTFRWLERTDDQGDFCMYPFSQPYSVVGPGPECRLMIYTPKPGRWCTSPYSILDCQEVGLIGRYGLPNQHDYKWIASLTAGIRCLFVGDADPADLLIFSCLRAHMQIEWFGVSDLFLERLGSKIDDNHTIRLSVPEQEGLRAARKFCPDLATLLGPNCFEILSGGRKVELEAAVSRATVDAALWFAN